jgi:protein involved in polysaccharide export with SLBB domain
VAVIVVVPTATPVTLPELSTVATAVLDDFQVTAELKPPVPVTVAVHCEVAPVTTVVGLQETVTEVMVGVGGAE